MVSIVVPVYNAAPYIGHTIASVQAQSCDSWELILIDNGSSDDSRAICEQAAGEDPRIRTASGGKGAAGARNLGISLARGRYIAFLDADDIWLPEKLSSELAFMEDRGAGFAFTSYEFGDENAVPTGKKVHAPASLDLARALTRTVIFTSTVMIDRELIPEELIHFPDIESEDTAMWWTILKAGYTAYGLDRVLTIYRRPAVSLSSNKARSIRRIYGLYRNIAGLSPASSVCRMAGWAVRATLRRL